ncbi:hypothetical protein [Cryptosporangium japonicum]|uniref:Uncharacterized protein n=1 Tax=Cryptosporangium japonicum TaxID=80872 RepID=A0ABN0TM83_9ACTN
MSSLDDAKEFVARHEKEIDEATGKAGGLPEEEPMSHEPVEPADGGSPEPPES